MPADSPTTGVLTSKLVASSGWIVASVLAGLFAGAMSIVTYGLALWAYRLGDTPRLAALREAWEAWNESMPAIPDDATVSLGYGYKDMPQR